MVCVAQAFCLMGPSYPRLTQKSTVFAHPSQFVYNTSNFDQILLILFINRSKILAFCTLTGHGSVCYYLAR